MKRFYNKYKKIISTIALMTLLIFVLNIFMTSNDKLNKINTFIQMAYTVLTAALVILTFCVLHETKSQKHHIVRPYLVVSECDIWEKKCKRYYEYYVINEGVGLALDIRVNITRKKDSLDFYQKEFTRLNIAENAMYHIMEDISNSLRKEYQGKSVYEGNVIYDEIEVTGELEDYHDILITIIYNDIYDKKYKSTFELKFDSDKKEYNDCVEKFFEM